MDRCSQLSDETARHSASSLPTHQPVNITYVCHIPHHSCWMPREDSRAPTRPFLPASQLWPPCLVPLLPSSLLDTKPVVLSYHLQGVFIHSCLGVHFLPFLLFSLCFPVPHPISSLLYALLKSSPTFLQSQRVTPLDLLLLARYLKKSALPSPPLSCGKKEATSSSLCPPLTLPCTSFLLPVLATPVLARPPHFHVVIPETRS